MTLHLERSSSMNYFVHKSVTHTFLLQKKTFFFSFSFFFFRLFICLIFFIYRI